MCRYVCECVAHLLTFIFITCNDLTLLHPKFNQNYYLQWNMKMMLNVQSHFNFTPVSVRHLEKCRVKWKRTGEKGRCVELCERESKRALIRQRKKYTKKQMDYNIYSLIILFQITVSGWKFLVRSTIAGTSTGFFSHRNIVHSVFAKINLFFVRSFLHSLFVCAFLDGSFRLFYAILFHSYKERTNTEKIWKFTKSSFNSNALIFICA